MPLSSCGSTRRDRWIGLPYRQTPVRHQDRCHRLRCSPARAARPVGQRFPLWLLRLLARRQQGRRHLERTTTPMTTERAEHLGSQHLEWLLVSELEMAPPQWGRPLRPGDIRAMAHDFDPDKLGAVAIWARKNLPAGRGRYVICDGQHRVAAIRMALGNDQRCPCLIY